jgi:large subunit ribosomal protein L6
MSRVAKNPISILKGAQVSLQDSKIEVSGPKGKDEFSIPRTVSMEQSDSQLLVKYDEGSMSSTALAGTTRSIVNNMIIGVTEGFQKKLELVGVGYRAKVSGKSIDLTLGFSHPVKYDLPDAVTAETPSNTEIVLSSHNKQILGQVAAEIRAFRSPEPYKGKGIKYADERIKRKEAKKAAAGA